MRARLMLCLFLTGCHEFADPSTVVDLRLLAAAIEPPELILDPAVPLPAFTLTPLLLDPKGAGRPVDYQLRACANDPTAPSAPGAGAEASGNYPAGGARSSVGSAPCPPAGEGSASWALPAGAPPFSITLSPAMLEAAFKADVFPGHLGRLHGGFDLGLPITFELRATAGSETALAQKRLIVWAQPLSPEHRANQNPRVTEVVAYADRDPATYLPTGVVSVLAPDAPLVVAAGGKIWIEPKGAMAEPYVTAVVDRLTDETRAEAVPAETLRYSYYATAGKFDPRESTSELGFGAVAGGRVPVEARYEAPSTPGPVRVFIVVRDERGGASWTERAIAVE